MDGNKLIRIGVALIGLSVVMLLFFLNNDKTAEYQCAQGKVFGTYYTIHYEHAEDLHDSIRSAFDAFDHSLSMFNPHSTLSAINSNKDTVVDLFFEQMWEESERVHALSNGAFDITVAPLVNLWGFGRRVGNKRPSGIDSAQVDSLMPFIGMNLVQLVDGRVIKQDARVMLDGGAVAKGLACDIIADLLARNGCTNYLVEIGGELVSRGMNSKGQPWRVGISQPTDDTSGQQELQTILSVNDICMATSGNYRNFYYDGDAKRSHTIDPRTGYPVQHSLLSATVVSSSCMRADALATACMVEGAEAALEMIEQAGDAACFLIVAQGDSTVVITSENWK